MILPFMRHSIYEKRVSRIPHNIMPKQESHSDFSRAHDAFESMGMRDRAVFLVEATASTFIRGIEKTSSVVADELNDLFHRAERKTEKEAPDAPDNNGKSGAGS